MKLKESLGMFRKLIYVANCFRLLVSYMFIFLLRRQLFLRRYFFPFFPKMSGHNEYLFFQVEMLEPTDSS